MTNAQQIADTASREATRANIETLRKGGSLMDCAAARVEARRLVYISELGLTKNSNWTDIGNACMTLLH